MGILLDIGSGFKNESKKGFLRVDPYVKDSDLKDFAWDLSYEDNVVDEIFSSHMLEHLYKRQVIPTLKEWYRVIKPKGKLIVTVPDLEWCCNWWLNHQTNGWDLDIIYGGQSRKGETHRTGFNRQIMIDYLREAGFTVKKFEELETHNQKTLSFECIK